MQSSYTQCVSVLSVELDIRDEGNLFYALFIMPLVVRKCEKLERG